MHLFPSIPFLLAAILLAITPGPGLAYVAARTVAGGRSEGIASSFGNAIGGLVHVVAAALGLSFLIAQSAVAYSVVKYLGAAYLIYLGIRTLRARAASAEMPIVSRAGVRKALRDGILVETLNVKTAIFFLAFIPQFVSAASPSVPQFIVLGMVCVVLNTVADLIVVAAAHRFVASGTARATRERFLSRVSGVTMLLLGTFVALREN